VVFLRKVDPVLSRPWDHAAVVVEHRDRRLRILQGGSQTPVGFVRRGDKITIVSRELDFNALHADGAAFFSLAFPDPDQPLTRTLSAAGHVELTSAAGAFWMRGHLFVDDHPYYTRTDAAGQFELRRVPPGRYQVVCWLPNWHARSRERDAESGLVIRMDFQPSVEQAREVVLDAAGQVDVTFTMRAESFKR
jgi:hypothetical protein